MIAFQHIFSNHFSNTVATLNIYNTLGIKNIINF